MAITRRLRLLWRRFSPLEERLFAAVRSVLPRPAVATFAAQVGAITHVQRLPGWTEIDYYARRAGRVDWSRVPLFPRGGEFPLARVWFVVRGRRYRVTLSCVEGHIFDFGITPSPQGVAFADWDSAPTTELLGDPLSTGDIAARERMPTAWEEALRTVRAQADAAGWTLHDARVANRVTLHEGEFLVLAERDGDEFVLHRTEPPSEVMFHLTSHDGTPEPMRGEVGDILSRPRRDA
jgi:hypothetical protein